MVVQLAIGLFPGSSKVIKYDTGIVKGKTNFYIIVILALSWFSEVFTF